MEQADAEDNTGSPSDTNRDEAIHRLATIQRGLITLGHLVYATDLDQHVEIGPQDLAAVIHVFGYGVEGALRLLAPKE